ncbi:unnamed protein product [Brachionus calyciflorus]|uniref:OTU domain-containing protein n=1 Tax=Brachionus calyciflorus TaxID=104777 RepID=A0A814NXQ9_9BILA|nr:unnamed protein product [Brachionus calyciflorus]
MNEKSSSNQKLEEIWMDKNSRPKREKSTFYKNVPSFLNNNLDLNQEQTNLHECSEFSEIFENNLTSIGYTEVLKELYKIMCTDNEISFQQIKMIFESYKINLGKFREFIRGVNSLNKSEGHIVDETFFGLLKINNILNFKPISVPKDGNCFYESLSILYFGSRELFFLFKLGSIFTIFENEYFFIDILNGLKYEFNLEKLIQRTRKKNECACELKIISLSIFLNKTILVFGYDPKDSYQLNVKYAFCGVTENCLPIGFIINHFVPLLSNVDDGVLPDIQIDLYSEYRKKFLKI